MTLILDEALGAGSRSFAGHSASEDARERAYDGESIFFARSCCEGDGPLELGFARVRQF
jgi:hypothetical protein